jgi:hypothetical protein
MIEYRFTFGMKYRDEPHPAGSWPHPDGWLTVYAENGDQARQLAGAVIGHVDNDPRAPFAYAFDYSPEQWSQPTRRGGNWDEMYPLGCLARVTFQILE